GVMYFSVLELDLARDVEHVLWHGAFAGGGTWSESSTRRCESLRDCLWQQIEGCRVIGGPARDRCAIRVVFVETTLGTRCAAIGTIEQRFQFPHICCREIPGRIINCRNRKRSPFNHIHFVP